MRSTDPEGGGSLNMFAAWTADHALALIDFTVIVHEVSGEEGAPGATPGVPTGNGFARVPAGVGDDPLFEAHRTRIPLTFTCEPTDSTIRFGARLPRPDVQTTVERPTFLDWPGWSTTAL